MSTNLKTINSSLLVLLIFLLYFPIAYVPSVSDNFDYWHMAYSISADKAGHIDSNYQNGGYYIYTIIIAKVANILYDDIPLVPFQAIPLIFLMLGILINMYTKDDRPYLVIIASVMMIITKYGNKSYFLYWSHGLGVLLTLVVITAISLRLRSNRNRQSISIILIISVVSLNYISYKLTFFNIILLVALQIAELINNSDPISNKENRVNLITILTIFVVFVFSFNMTIYNSILPRIRMTNELTSTGISKLYIFFQENSFDLLNGFYFRYPASIRNALTIWLFLILIGLVLNNAYIFKKIILRRKLEISDRIILGFTTASFAIFTLYSFIGLSDFSYIIFAGYISYATLYKANWNSKKYKYLISFLIIFILCINAYLTISLASDDFYSGVKDENYCRYLDAPSDWYMSNMIDTITEKTSSVATDVFTGSYFSKELAKESIPLKYSPNIFSRDDMSLILGLSKDSSCLQSTAFIFNYKLHHFSADYWETYNSWLKSRQLIENNQYLNTIYSSGDVTIGVVRQHI